MKFFAMVLVAVVVLAPLGSAGAVTQEEVRAASLEQSAQQSSQHADRRAGCCLVLVADRRRSCRAQPDQPAARGRRLPSRECFDDAN